MSKMVICVATHFWEGWKDCMRTWFDNASDPYLDMRIVTKKEVVPAYQECYASTVQPILAFIHDDVEILEKNWDERVMKEFEDPTVGMVGFGGALGHGVPHLYQVPYRLPDLARQDFLSNMKEAEAHGKRFTGERDVAVIDGFAGFVRRSVIDGWLHTEIRITGNNSGEIINYYGFPHNKPIGYYMLWENLCCECRRQGYRIRLVGVSCNHIGGRTSTIAQVKDDYEAEHKYFYEHNRDVMPYRVPV